MENYPPSGTAVSVHRTTGAPPASVPETSAEARVVPPLPEFREVVAVPPTSRITLKAEDVTYASVAAKPPAHDLAVESEYVRASRATRAHQGSGLKTAPQTDYWMTYSTYNEFLGSSVSEEADAAGVVQLSFPGGTVLEATPPKMPGTAFIRLDPQMCCYAVSGIAGEQPSYYPQNLNDGRLLNGAPHGIAVLLVTDEFSRYLTIADPRRTFRAQLGSDGRWDPLNFPFLDMSYLIRPFEKSHGFTLYQATVEGLLLADHEDQLNFGSLGFWTTVRTALGLSEEFRFKVVVVQGGANDARVCSRVPPRKWPALPAPTRHSVGTPAYFVECVIDGKSTSFAIIVQF